MAPFCPISYEPYPISCETDPIFYEFNPISYELIQYPADPLPVKNAQHSISAKLLNPETPLMGFFVI
jgi:hypothetical protein